MKQNAQVAQNSPQTSESTSEKRSQGAAENNANQQNPSASNEARSAQTAQNTDDKGLTVALNKVNGNPDQLTSHEKSLINTPSQHYTLQLYGARKLELAENMIAKHNLDGNAKIYHTKFQNKDWYVLVYGDYNSSSEALSAISKLPAGVQKLKPWAKPVAAVKESIRASLAAPLS